jgi:serine/threonine-protein kinase
MGINASFDEVISQYGNGSQSAEDLDDADDEEDQKKRRRMIIIGSVIAALIILGAIITLVLVSCNGDNSEKVTVPDFSKTTTEQQACKRLQELELVCDIQTIEDMSDEGTFLKVDPAARSKVDKGTTITVLFSAGPSEGVIPKIDGLSEKDARDKLDKAGYVVSSAKTMDCILTDDATTDDEKALISVACKSKSDQTVGTKPRQGTKLTKGSSVTLYTFSGTTEIPNLRGKKLDEARDIVGKLGLSLKEGDTVETEDVPDGTIAEQSPGVGNSDEKPTIDVRIAKAPEKVKVPNVIGKPLETAKGYITQVGLQVNVIEQPTTDQSQIGKVIDVNPGEGEELKKGETVSISVGVAATPPSSAPTSPPTSPSSPSTSPSSTKKVPTWPKLPVWTPPTPPQKK